MKKYNKNILSIAVIIAFLAIAVASSNSKGNRGAGSPQGMLKIMIKKL